jgi:hypothetical protein
VPHGASFVVYIDESGDEGFRFKKTSDQQGGSSEWFVLSAAIVATSQDLRLVHGVREAIGRLSRSNRFHFVQMRHDRRIAWIDQISKFPITAASVIVHKPTLQSQSFENKWALYFYTTRFLLERVSWFCRDRRPENDTGNGKARLVFSNRANLPYEELRTYVRKLGQNPSVKIDWKVIDPDLIEPHFDHQFVCLQIADAIASGVASALELSRYGFTEDRYVKMIRKIVYSRSGNYSAYGMKFFPKPASEITSDARLEWARKYYP